MRSTERGKARAGAWTARSPQSFEGGHRGTFEILRGSSGRQDSAPLSFRTQRPHPSSLGATFQDSALSTLWREVQNAGAANGSAGLPPRRPLRGRGMRPLRSPRRYALRTGHHRYRYPPLTQGRAGTRLPTALTQGRAGTRPGTGAVIGTASRGRRQIRSGSPGGPGSARCNLRPSCGVTTVPLEDPLIILHPEIETLVRWIAERAPLEIGILHDADGASSGSTPEAVSAPIPATGSGNGVAPIARGAGVLLSRWSAGWSPRTGWTWVRSTAPALVAGSGEKMSSRPSPTAVPLPPRPR